MKKAEHTKYAEILSLQISAIENYVSTAVKASKISI